MRDLGTDQLAWEKALEDMAPMSDPGTERIYHTATQGFILAGVIRRASGGSLQDLWRDGFAVPLKIDLGFGVPPDRVDDVADFVSLAEPQARLDPRAVEQILHFLSPPDFGRDRFRRGVIPFGNGRASAHDLAALYAALIGPAPPHHRSFLERATRERWSGVETLSGEAWPMAAGFMLSSDFAYAGPGRRSFGHPGRGGCTAFADPDRGLGFAYAPNALNPQPGSGMRARRLIEAVYAAL